MAGPGPRVKKGNGWFEERRGGCKRWAWQLKGPSQSHISSETVNVLVFSLATTFDHLGRGTE